MQEQRVVYTTRVIVVVVVVNHINQPQLWFFPFVHTWLGDSSCVWLMVGSVFKIIAIYQ